MQGVVLFFNTSNLWICMCYNTHTLPTWQSSSRYAFTHFSWQLNNMLETNRQMMSIVGSIAWDVYGFPCSKWRALYRTSWAELLPHSQKLRTVHLLREGQLMHVSPPRRHMCCHISPRLSNVPLIYTCWAQRSIGVRRSLRASITQRALLLPFKIHLNLFTGANVQPRADAMILMPHCEKCFTAVFGWKQLGTSALHCFDSVSEQKVI